MSGPDVELFALDRPALRERELRKRISELESSARAAYQVWKTSPLRTRDGMLGQYMEDLNIVLQGRQ